MVSSIFRATILACVLGSGALCTASEEIRRLTLASAYSTNFSTIDSDKWSVDVGCVDCYASNPDECTMNFESAIATGSVEDGIGLTITTTKKDDSFDYCTTDDDEDVQAGGSSGKLTSSFYVSFGTIRVKSKYFPTSGAGDEIATAKGFVGLEDSSSGAITITIHGDGADPSGAPKNADWTKYMQSSIYQHGDDHNKEFTDLASAVDSVADEFNWYEVNWTSDSVTISVNDVVVREVTNSDLIPQSPLKVQLHSRSIAYSEMPDNSKFQSYIEEFQFEPAR